MRRFFLHVVIILLAALPAWADSSCRDAQDVYKNLRKGDPGVSDLRAWEGAAAGLRNCLVNNSADARQTPETLYLLGELFERTYKQRSYLTGKRRAIYFYARLIGEYPAADFSARATRSLKRLSPDRSLTPSVRSTKAQSSETKSVTTSAPQAEFQALPLPTLIPGKPVVVIDPGHGGEEAGAWGHNNVYEKDIVLQISLKLQELLNERLAVNAVLTRTKDVDIPLAARTKFANDLNADLFVSVHANASPSKTARGIETYYLNTTNDNAALKLAERENSSVGPVNDLSFIISDLIQSAKIDRSISLAHYLQDALYKKISSRYSEVKNLGVKKGPFYVLVGAHMPCALTEVSFIDNSIEGARLATPEYQALIAEALFNGIKTFFAKQSTMSK